MDWDNIKLFQKVAETGSFSKAAQSLNISQPTASRRMKQFQQGLALDLFIRTEQGLSLSTHGKMLYPLAVEMVENAHAFKIASQSLTKEEKTVRIACSPLIGLALNGRLPEILQEMDQVNIALLTSTDFVNLEHGEADLAIRNQLPEKGNLLAKKVGHNNFGIYASPTYVEKNKAGIEKGDFSNCDWIGYHKNMAHLPSSRWMTKNMGVTIPDIQLDSSLLILEAVTQGRGLAILPTYVERPKNLIPIKKPLNDLVFQSWLVSHKQSANDPVLALMKDRITVVLREILKAA